MRIKTSQRQTLNIIWPQNFIVELMHVDILMPTARVQHWAQHYNYFSQNCADHLLYCTLPRNMRFIHFQEI